MSEKKEYRRLTRLRWRGGKSLDGFFSYAGLWLGSDHLLSIRSNRFSEEYKRFYFRDIQTIAVVKTTRREIWNVALLILLLIAGAFSFSRPAGSGVFAAFFGLLILMNNLLGPSCTVYLRTAVQMEELRSLKRLRRARRMLARIRPLIAATQGELAPEEASLRIRELYESSGAGRRTRFATSPLNLSVH